MNFLCVKEGNVTYLYISYTVLLERLLMIYRVPIKETPTLWKLLLNGKKKVLERHVLQCLVFHPYIRKLFNYGSHNSILKKDIFTEFNKQVESIIYLQDEFKTRGLLRSVLTSVTAGTLVFSWVPEFESRWCSRLKNHLQNFNS